LYVKARETNPARWSRHTRNWTPIGAVALNPEKEAVVSIAPMAPDKHQEAA